MNTFRKIFLASLSILLVGIAGCGGGGSSSSSSSSDFPRDIPIPRLSDAYVWWVSSPSPCLGDTGCVRIGAVIRSYAELDDYVINHDGPHTPALLENIMRYRTRAILFPNASVDFATQEIIALDLKGTPAGIVMLTLTEYENRIEVSGIYTKYGLTQSGGYTGDQGLFLVVPISKKPLVRGKFVDQS